jgi:hypothetical protein
MGLTTAWDQLWNKGSLSGAFGGLWIDDANAAAAARADAALAQMNDLDYLYGRQNAELYYERMDRLAQDDLDVVLRDPASSPWEGFKEGLEEGADNLQQGVKKTIAGTINYGFGMIPWQLWALALVAGGVWVYWKFLRK